LTECQAAFEESDRFKQIPLSQVEKSNASISRSAFVWPINLLSHSECFLTKVQPLRKITKFCQTPDQVKALHQSSTLEGRTLLLKPFYRFRVVSQIVVDFAEAKRRTNLRVNVSKVSRKSLGFPYVHFSL